MVLVSSGPLCETEETVCNFRVPPRGTPKPTKTAPGDPGEGGPGTPRGPPPPTVSFPREGKAVYGVWLWGPAGPPQPDTGRDPQTVVRRQPEGIDGFGSPGR